MALDLNKDYKTTFDAATGAEHVVTVDKNTGEVNDLGVRGVALVSGNPAYGVDASGADAYTTVVTAPAHSCHYLSVHLAAGTNALISLDGGVTDHLFIQAADVDIYECLDIPAGTAIKAKNAALGAAADGSLTFANQPANADTVTLGDGIHTATIFEFDDGVAATGSLTLTGNPADGNTITISDGVHSSTILEFDSGTVATGSISLSANPADADTITIDDGPNPAVIFEFDSGVQASGGITLTGNPADGNTITIDDGTNTPTTFEFDSGVVATGGITLTANPADGGTITIGDGVHTTTVFEFDTGKAATGTLAFSDQPTDGDTITISDGTTATVFEFDDDASTTPGNVAVTIGASIDATMAAFIVALNLEAFNVTAAPAVPADHTCTLANDAVGTAGNVAITHTWATTGDCVHTGMTGGLDAGDDVTGGNVGVAIGATKEDTMASLVVAINTAATLDVTATASTPADNICTLANDSVGVVGNVTTLKSGANITVTGLTGGLDAGTAITPGNVGVVIGASKEATMVNLVAVILAAASLSVTPTASTPPDNICTLQNDGVGTVGNETVTRVGANITVTGMVNGLNAGTDIVGGHVGVAIGASKEATMASLVTAVNTAASLTVTATASAPADNACTLANDAVGTAGNVAVTKSCANATVTGMTGGLAAGTDVAVGHTGVAIGVNKEATMANVVTIINGLALLDITATASAPPDHICTLANTHSSDDGNIAITKTGANITPVGMSGGVDPSNDVGAGHTGVSIGASKEATMATLVGVINSAANLSITATPSTPADAACTLDNDVPGTHGNVNITKSCANLTAVGMANGTTLSYTNLRLSVW